MFYLVTFTVLHLLEWQRFIVYINILCCFGWQEGNRWSRPCTSSPSKPNMPTSCNCILRRTANMACLWDQRGQLVKNIFYSLRVIFLFYTIEICTIYIKLKFLFILNRDKCCSYVNHEAKQQLKYILLTAIIQVC